MIIGGEESDNELAFSEPVESSSQYVGTTFSQKVRVMNEFLETNASQPVQVKNEFLQSDKTPNKTETSS
jgi:hypothetical protein